MERCDNCGKEDTIMSVACNTYNTTLLFCCPRCMVDFADRQKHPIQKSEYYAIAKESLEVKEVKQGCSKPSCCQNISCICRSFDAKSLLKKALKDEP